MKNLNSVFLFLMLVLVVDQAFANKVIGSFAVAKGKVEIVGADGKSTRARFGTKVNQGDTVVTDKDSRAKIILLDKNEVNISPETKMAFESYDITANAKKTNVIGVLYGKVRNNVKEQYDGKDQKFQVRTKAAIAGVRGTDFLCEYNQNTNQATFTTFAGLIEIFGPEGGFQNAILLYPGQQSNVFEGQDPSDPSNMSKEDLNNLNKESDSGSDDNGDQGKDGANNGDGKGKSWGKAVIEDMMTDDETVSESDSEFEQYGEVDILNKIEENQESSLVKATQSESCEFCKETTTSGTSNILVNVNLGN